MRAVGALLFLDAERRQPRCDLAVDREQRLSSGGHADPEHTRRAALGKRSGSVERQVERADRKRRPQRLADRLPLCIVNFSNEADGEVEAVGGHPRHLRARRRVSRAPLQFAAHLRRPSRERLADLHRHKQPHLCILARGVNRRSLMSRSLLAFVFFASFVVPSGSAFAQNAPAIPAATYRVVYLEVAPAEVNRVAAALKDYKRSAMNAIGALRIDVLQQVGRSSHFAIYESWRDNAALEGHKTANDTKKLDEVLQATRVSPVDERLLTAVGPPLAASSGTGSVYVITHADSVPPQRDAAEKALSDLTIRSRQESGNAIFLATVQPNRNNHFTIIELWKDEKALDAHAVADYTKKFRDTFGPFSGALFDERIYKSVG
ncbi:MAG: hypothetical protein DMF88_10445 [Acidobacteria bacterium]|nr:MAG: hypothetical protein DMF88_10445 [Acidobacteriota bacterium]